MPYSTWATCHNHRCSVCSSRLTWQALATDGWPMNIREQRNMCRQSVLEVGMSLLESHQRDNPEPQIFCTSRTLYIHPCHQEGFVHATTLRNVLARTHRVCILYLCQSHYATCPLVFVAFYSGGSFSNWSLWYMLLFLEKGLLRCLVAFIYFMSMFIVGV